MRIPLLAPLLMLLLASLAWAKDEVELIPRDALFGNPERSAVRISPDGKTLSWLAPRDGVMNLWVAPREEPSKARAVTRDEGRGIQQYFWAYDNRHLVYLQDEGGNENWHVFALEVASEKVRDLTPIEGVAARIQGVSPRRPHEILVGLNDRIPMLHDLYRVDLRTGERTLVLENPGFLGLMADDDFAVRAAARMRADGGTEFLEPNAEGGWDIFLSVSMEDAMTTRPLEWTKDGKAAYVLDSRGRDTAALVRLDMETAETTLLAEDPRADIAGAMIHPTEKTVEAAFSAYLKREWKILDPSLEAHLAVLRKLAEGEVRITDRSLDDRWWVVAHTRDDGPILYHLYDRTTKAATRLFTNQPALEDRPLVALHPVVIPARDGLPLVSYLSLPAPADPDGDARPTDPLPLVLLVHGGPWARDGWGFNPMHQWLANRGYAVLSVNFRGSTGFGKAFLNAANGEWAGAMQDDLLDAVAWAVKQGIADRERVAIAGGSYGGYATLVGLTFTPDTFACGVDIVGPSSLVTLLESVPPYWKPMLDMFKRRVGDPSTEAGRRDLLARSPLPKAGEIRRPLLIGQGANDPRVKQAEADQIVKALTSHEIPVVYVLYPDEGHGFDRPENRLSFFAVMEAFLAPILGGRHEALGNALGGSSIQVPAGAARIPGLEAALAATRSTRSDRTD